MAFKPAQQAKQQTAVKRDPNVKFPVPEGGNQPARISLIVDLGVQEREDFVDPNTKEVKPQKPIQQLAVFVDLVDNVVDYGGEIGEQHYRLMLNKSFKGEIAGVNFAPVPPRDGDGNIVEGKLWTFHPANLLTKLAKATGQTQILGENQNDNMDVEQLLNQPLMVDVEVKQTESDKKDDQGNKIVYTNVNPKVYATLPKVKGKPMEVSELNNEALLITFDNVTAESAKFIRGDVKRQIQKALNYEGSQMQKVLSALGNAPQEQPSKQEPVKELAADYDSFDESIPF